MRLVVLIGTTALTAGALLTTACTTERATPPRSASAAPAVLAPQPSADVRDTQQRLQTLGYYNGPIDGLWGPETAAAVERFQRSHGLLVTAQLDDSTRNTVRRAGDTSPVSVTNPTDVRTVQNRLRQLNYYHGRADGVWGSGTQVALERFQRSRGLEVGQLNRATLTAMGLDAGSFPARPATVATAGEPLDPAVVRGVQRRLHQLGYYSGRNDGVWGSRTQASVERFQRSRGLEPTGTLNPATASALGLDPNNLAASTAQVPAR